MKTKSQYVCQDSIVEEVLELSTAKKSNSKTGEGIITLGEVDTQLIQRIQTGINEIDRVFGGGITPGSLILVGGTTTRSR
ncbi:hypothetical protein LBMAG49_04290 [Planctomycetota bacterium]|nr:hypothetical protein LBMAG49_04290 [Planctomycetota bacterium]